MPEFFERLGEKREEYDKEYKPELERRIKERLEDKKTEGLDKLMKDMNVGSKPPRGMICMNVADVEPVHLDTISDGEDEDDGYLVDPDAMNDDDEGLQEKFAQAAKNAQINAEDEEFARWTKEVNRGGI
jgi:GPN-loop GTPase